MNRFSIKDIENLTGIKAHTIRIWEQRYGILAPKRTPTNIRYYDAADLKLALRIALLNNYGYKISHIHGMSPTDMSSLIQKINDADFRLQIIVNDMLEATLAMDTFRFEQLINSYIKRSGIEQTVEQLLFAFLEKIGIMWMTDRLIPAQEHLVSHIVYRKIALAFETFSERPSEDSPTVLLFLPQGEIHDIGLMYVNYLLLKFGKNPVYLGPNTPVSEVKALVEAKNPKYIYTHLTSVAISFDCNLYIAKLSSMFPDVRIMVSGGMLRSTKLKDLTNVQYFFSLKDVRDALISLP